jgi:hypothetical protein
MSFYCVKVEQWNLNIDSLFIQYKICLFASFSEYEWNISCAFNICLLNGNSLVIIIIQFV